MVGTRANKEKPNDPAEGSADRSADGSSLSSAIDTKSGVESSHGKFQI